MLIFFKQKLKIIDYLNYVLTKNSDNEKNER